AAWSGSPRRRPTSRPAWTRPRKKSTTSLPRGKTLLGVHRREWWGLLFVLPALAWKVGFNLIPMANAVYISFTTYDLLTPPRFVGAANYIGLASDARFKQAM